MSANPQYAPPDQRITCPRSLTKLINEASIAVQADNRRKWLEFEPIDTHGLPG